MAKAVGPQRRALIEWPNEQEAILSAAGWRVEPPKDWPIDLDRTKSPLKH